MYFIASVKKCHFGGKLIPGLGYKIYENLFSFEIVFFL